MAVGVPDHAEEGGVDAKEQGFSPYPSLEEALLTGREVAEQ